MKNLFEVMPSDPKKITKMLDIAHKEIQSSISLPVKNKASIDAAKEKISVSGKGGSGGSASKSTPARQNVGNKIHPSYLKGFTDEEIAELTQ